MVSATRDQLRHLILTVEDTGVGIAEEDREVVDALIAVVNLINWRLTRANIVQKFNAPFSPKNIDSEVIKKSL